MDSFQLRLIQEEMLRDLSTASPKKLYSLLKILTTHSKQISLTDRLHMNLALRRSPLITSNNDLLLLTRALFPYYRTGSGGK